MKKNVLFCVCIMMSLLASAQYNPKDYMSKVYFYGKDSVKVELEEINSNYKISTGFMSAKVKLEYEGTSAPVTLSNGYIYIEPSATLQQSIRNFKMVSMIVKDGRRNVSAFKANLAGTKMDDKNAFTLDYEKVGDNVYRINISVLPDGHYGIFYNYANNMATKIWDFDIKK